MPPGSPFVLTARASLPGFRLEVSLEVAGGETLALVGPNGSGKTTCLALGAGLLRPEEGRVALGDEIWCDTRAGIDVPPHRRHIGLVQQQYALFPHLDVEDNIAYGSLARGSGRKAARAAAEGWMDRLGLRELAGRATGELSGGQLQKVALARALASGARVLLLDEPFAALDVAARTSVRGELRSFLHELGLPTLLVTHDATDALSLADRIAVIEEGRITQNGTRDELLSRPQTPFVAELVGLNLYRAGLGRGGDLREARANELVFHVLAHGGEGPIWLAFAPSSVTLSAEQPHGSAQNVFAGRVRELLPLADRLRVVVDVGVPMAADVTREAASALTLAPGRRVWASVKATAIDVYR
jgi:molybdate transport system ATP-binding protein